MVWSPGHAPPCSPGSPPCVTLQCGEFCTLRGPLPLSASADVPACSEHWPWELPLFCSNSSTSAGFSVPLQSSSCPAVSWVLQCGPAGVSLCSMSHLLIPTWPAEHRKVVLTPDPLFPTVPLQWVLVTAGFRSPIPPSCERRLPVLQPPGETSTSSEGPSAHLPRARQAVSTAGAGRSLPISLARAPLPP